MQLGEMCFNNCLQRNSTSHSLRALFSLSCGQYVFERPAFHIGPGTEPEENEPSLDP